MKILGLDPGSSLTGFGVIETTNGGMKAVSYGVLDFTGLEEKERFLGLSKGIKELVHTHKPERVALESLFFAKNKKTALIVSEARGIIKLAVAEAGVELVEYRPAQVKQAISTYGRAQKDEVKKMVKILLGIEGKLDPDDVADALAIAICCASHLWIEKTS